MKQIILLNVDKTCPLSLNARLVYSHLVYRGRLGKGATCQQIAATWGLNRTRVVSAAIRELGSLVTKKGSCLFAAEPLPGWFVLKKKPQTKWQDTLTGFKVPLKTKACKWRLNQWITYWLIHSKSQQKPQPSYCYAYLAKLLSCEDEQKTYRSVRNTIKKLVAEGFVKQGFYHKKLFRLPVVGSIPDNWMVTTAAKQPASAATTVPTSAAQPTSTSAPKEPSYLERLRPQLGADDMSYIKRRLDTENHFLLSVINLLHKVPQEHRRNVETNPKYGNSDPEKWGPYFMYQIRKVRYSNTPTADEVLGRKKTTQTAPTSVICPDPKSMLLNSHEERISLSQPALEPDDHDVFLDESDCLEEQTTVHEVEEAFDRWLAWS